ncbi:MAG TPA: hypothetical protein ENF30_01755 [Candidatus Desulfofervidus auxilii]|uniref:Uncharacterized protein n=1 Tax=Desulfofervidus auxilii TaxID=1621989 RepID=A0A7V0IAC0_DESA2|nr:hypothetical protein [Candidatus Desulfofervidus auxilii]
MIRTILILTLIVMAIAYFSKESNRTNNRNVEKTIYCLYKKIKMFIEKVKVEKGHLSKQRDKKALMSKSHSEDKNPDVIRQIEADKTTESNNTEENKQQDYNKGLYEQRSRKLQAVSKILETGYDKR